LRTTDILERAGAALARLIFGGRCAAGREKLPQSRRRILGHAPQLIIEANHDPTPRLAIKQRAFTDWTTDHFLETQGLRAKLRFVRAMRLGLAALIFDRIRRLLSFRRPVELDDVGQSHESQPPRGERHRRDAPKPTRVPRARLLSRGVEDAPLGGEAVLLPQPLDMDERRLPEAIDAMLECRDGDGVVDHQALTPPVRSLRLVLESSPPRACRFDPW
jgi:hypothetical protein